MSEKGIYEKVVDIPPRTNWIGDWLRWCPTSAELLEQAETKMFSYLRKPPETSFVPITSNNEDGEYKIRTLVTNKEAEGKATPLVLLHGFASGIGLWILNIDSLSQDRPLYALDILGFGLSSRPIFSTEAEDVENQFVDSPGLVKRMRPDILQKFENVIADTSCVGNYIYHCNAQYPSGEAAFKSMSAPFGWANRPMIEQIPQLSQDVPISFIYGAKSWIDSSSGYKIRELRNNSFVEIKLIQGAGHHVYADKADEFNKIVSNICTKVDLGKICTSKEKISDISNTSLTVDDCEEKNTVGKFL